MAGIEHNAFHGPVLLYQADEDDIWIWWNLVVVAA